MNLQKSQVNSEESSLLPQKISLCNRRVILWIVVITVLVGVCVGYFGFYWGKQKVTLKVSQPFAFKSGGIGDASVDGFSRTDSNLVFFEDFDGDSSLTSGVWKIARTMDGGGNGQFQYYTDSPANVYVNSSDGSLRLKPALFEDMPPINGVPSFDVMTGKCQPYPACANFHVPDCTTKWGCQGTGDPLNILKPTTSGSVNTKGSFDYTYGRLEIRARMPRGDWLWPGLWLMPSNSIYGGWPNDGEIDLIETRGNAPGYMAQGGNPAGRDVVLSTLHVMGNVFWKSQGKGTGIDWTEDYHTFGMYWSDEEFYSYYLGENDEEIKMIDLSKQNGGYKNGFGRDPYGYNATTDNSINNIYRSNLTPPKVGVYDDAPISAPFDQPFYLIFNVAVGGAQNGCPDPDYWGKGAIWCTRCWPVCTQPTNEFYYAKDSWYPTWQSAEEIDKLSMAIDWIKVWQ